MRSIYCPPCAETFAARYPGITQDGTPRKTYEASAANGEEEWSRMVSGAARTNFRCDACAGVIALGQRAVAITAWKASRPIAAWEASYIMKTARVVPSSGNGHGRAGSTDATH